jgi:hypothetical protein
MTEMSVTASGQERYCRLARGTFQGAESRARSGAEMNGLPEALPDLPAENQSPPPGRLSLLSFPQGTNRVISTCDSAAPPATLQNIYDIIWNADSQK